MSFSSNKVWDQHRQEKILRQVKEKEEEEFKECTFRPNVSPTPKKLNSNMLAQSNHVDLYPGIEDHLTRQEKARQISNEKNRNPFTTGERWSGKTTVPKYPNLSDQQRFELQSIESSNHSSDHFSQNEAKTATFTDILGIRLEDCSYFKPGYLSSAREHLSRVETDLTHPIVSSQTLPIDSNTRDKEYEIRSQHSQHSQDFHSSLQNHSKHPTSTFLSNPSTTNRMQSQNSLYALEDAQLLNAIEERMKVLSSKSLF